MCLLKLKKKDAVNFNDYRASFLQTLGLILGDAGATICLKGPIGSSSVMHLCILSLGVAQSFQEYLFLRHFSGGEKLFLIV